MGVAALYDIHGNVDALDAVLQEVMAEEVDYLVIGGDIAWGAFPRETVARIRDLEEAVAIRGNADREVATRAHQDDGLQDWVAEVNLWCADQLDKDARDFLAQLPETRRLAIEVFGDVLFCHGTPRSDEEIVTPLTPDEDLEEVLATIDQRLVVCGHTHSQFDRTAGEWRLVNAGSIGLPYEDSPGAYWVLIGNDISLRRTEYDVRASAARIRASDCPHAERFAAAITSPIPRQTAIENFEHQRTASR